MDFKSLRITCALLLPLLWVEGVWALPCLSKNYYLNSQADVDRLGAAGCTRIKGDLVIRNSSDITNVDSLANIRWIDEDLIISNNSALRNVDGLANLQRVWHSVTVYYNRNLTNLDGLANMTIAVGGLSITGNSALTNLNGLAGLRSVAVVGIRFNP